MDTKIFKENRNKNHPNESLPFNSMTALMKSVSRKTSGKKTKKYKFTGNRAMAKRVRGNNYILQPPSYYRLSVIKSRIVKSKPWYNLDQKILAVNEHIKYLVRNEVAIDGKCAQFFDSESDDVYGKKFAIDIAQDRHHFRFIVSPEDSLEVDLKAHARNLVKQMEQDLGVKLKWIGVVHKNTDNPHIHLVIKGTEPNGKDLIIKPDYISHGMRFRSSDLLTRELGPRSELSIAKAKQRALLQNRAIAIDYKIAELVKAHDGKFTPFIFKDLDQIKAAQVRIKHLQSLGLAIQPTNWPKNFYQINLNLIEKLKDLEAHHDIYKKISRFGINEVRQHISKQSMIGKVISKGLHDELNATYYVILDGADGNKWYVDLSKHRNVEELKVGQTIMLESKNIANKDQGATINQPNKIYAQRLHFDQNQSLPDLVKAPGVTVLDRCLVNKDLQAVISNNGVGAEIKAALKERQQILVNRGLTNVFDQKITINKNLFDSLRKQELEHYKNMLRKEGYNVHDEIPKGFTGNVKNKVNLSGINYVVIEGKGQSLAIVPITNKEFLKLQGKNVLLSYRIMDNGIHKIIMKPIDKRLMI